MSDISIFLDEHKLRSERFNEKVEFYIPDFLAKGLITMIYADGGQGKSYLSLCLAKTLLQRSVGKLVYLDFDNPLSVLRQRGVGELCERHDNLNYIHRSSLDIPPFELLLRLEADAVRGAYAGWVFIIDSIRNFTDVNNDIKVMRVMNGLMNIRDAGGTIVLLHHANKDGKNYQGSNNIRNSIDCMYQLKKHHSNDGEINISLNIIKERAGIKDIGFCLDIAKLEMRELELMIAYMSEYEENFVSEAKRALSQKPLNKTQLLQALGHKKDDNTARDTLDKFEGTFWESKKQGNSYVYQLPATSATSTTTPKEGNIVQVAEVA
jgi:archaellum biogenesis ATPase FlaH